VRLELDVGQHIDPQAHDDRIQQHGTAADGAGFLEGFDPSPTGVCDSPTLRARSTMEMRYRSAGFRRIFRSMSSKEYYPTK